MSDIHLSGFLFNASGAALESATVEAFAKNTVTETGGTAAASTTTNSSGYYTMTVTSDNEYDVRITSGNSVRWRRFDDRVQIEEIEVSTLNIREGATAQVYTIAPGSISADRTLTLPAATGSDTLASLGLAQTFTANQAFTGTVTVGTDGSGTDVIFYSGTAGDNLTWDASEELLTITGTNGATALNVADGNVTIADNLTVSGNLTVTGTTTSVDSTTINAATAFVFEGATADAHETTLGIVDPTADATINLPAMSAGTYYLPVMAAASTTSVSSTPAELNLLDGSTANTVVNSKAVIYGSGGEIAGTLSGAAQTAITSLGTLTALTVDDVAINGKVITMTGDTSDTIVLTAGAAGTLTLVTTDAAGSAADVTVDADGEIVLDAADAAGIIIKINGTAQLSVVDGSITPTTNNDIDLGTSSYQFKNGYFDGTLEADDITIGGTNVVTGSLVTTLGTVSAGVWQGTAIASGYIANDAIDSQHYADGSIDNAHIADDAIDSEHYAAGSIDTAHIADNQVTAAKLADIARGSIIYGNASAATAELTKGGANTVLTSDGTDISWAAASGGTSLAVVLALS